ncbi:6-phospho-1-fructokinase [Perkinsela sp. CCAP 1560/4]|nr:6-phospho-1-fructokinase [Perkinsela sp. CCAP 1560/4]|eukprot:KNH07108.1 6-phospho-1-fructokinase [Perkinsela sp. CCAP 1560/4]
MSKTVIKPPKKFHEDTELSLKNLSQESFEVSRLPIKAIRFPNPLILAKKSWKTEGIFLTESSRILADTLPDADQGKKWTMRLAGPRADLHFEPSQTIIGVVTCGGLCPGLNDVIQGIVSTALEAYDVKAIYGFRYGYWGLSAQGKHSAIDLTYNLTRGINQFGGSFLGTSRGPQDSKEIVDTLVQYKVNILFTIGGDGTQRGASNIVHEVRKRKLDIAVVGIPKTIDNDISFSHRTFGFETAVEQAVSSIRCAYAEAKSHLNGIGLVKVMGRHSGFIAAQAVLACACAHICLIPECPISKKTFLELVDQQLGKDPFCVIVVAEGFGQTWFSNKSEKKDPSGNVKLMDIGEEIQETLKNYKRTSERKVSTIKYIDPSYTIRSCTANSSDAAFCAQLAMLAVHEAMYGVTDALVLSWYDHFVTLPIMLATRVRKVVDLRGKLWSAVRQITADLDNPQDDQARKKKLQRELHRLCREKKQIKSILGKL